MNDTRTAAGKYASWVNAVNLTAKAGWTCIRNWVFQSPSGSLHDLSASDLSKLEMIEKQQLCLATA